MNGSRQPNPTDERELVDAAIADYLGRTDAGEVVNREAFLEVYPDVAAEMREFFEHYDTVSELVRSI